MSGQLFRSEAGDLNLAGLLQLHTMNCHSSCIFLEEQVPMDLAEMMSTVVISMQIAKVTNSQN